MEACLAVEREQEKVVKKLKTVTGSTTEKLQQVLDQIQALKDQLTAGKCAAGHLLEPSLYYYVCTAGGVSGGEATQEQRETVRQCMRRVKEAAQTASNEHKDMHATISKLGKAIDKVCVYAGVHIIITHGLRFSRAAELQCGHIHHDSGRCLLRPALPRPEPGHM